MDRHRIIRWRKVDYVLINAVSREIVFESDIKFKATYFVGYAISRTT
jgi:hypothetical protein